MQLLLSLKSYENYFSLLLANKKNSEWEAALHNMKENKELEKRFIDRMAEESELSNINYLINKLWSEYKKFSTQPKTIKQSGIEATKTRGNSDTGTGNFNNVNNNLFSNLEAFFNSKSISNSVPPHSVSQLFPLNTSNNSSSLCNNNLSQIKNQKTNQNLGFFPLVLLNEILEVFFTQNPFIIKYLENDFSHNHKNFVNLFFLIFVKSIKIFNHDAKYVHKLEKFVDFIVQKTEGFNFNSIYNWKNYIVEILTNQGMCILLEKIVCKYFNSDGKIF